MQAVQYSQAKHKLKTLIDKVCSDFDEFVITTKDNKSAVLMSYEDYASLRETMHLLSSRTNRERLLSAVNQIEKGEFKTREIAP